MKKKISLLGLVLISLSFTGCGSKSDVQEYDKSTLEEQANMILYNFSMMTGRI